MRNPKDSPSIEALLYQAQKEGILPLTSRCNMACVFCSNGYNPPTCEIFTIPPRDLDEVRETLPWLGATRGPIVIGESVTRINEGEPFTHPHILGILELVRKSYPDRPIRVTTNGSLLNPGLIEELSRLKVELIISLNTVGFRKEVMGDNAPQTTLRNVSLLQGRVSFEGSIVALPFLTGWEDLRATIGFLKEKGASLVRVLCPGFSSRHPLAKLLTPTLWDEVREFALNLRRTFKFPILVEPPRINDLLPKIEEILPGSPAKEARLLPGDVVRKVNGLEVLSRKEAFEMARDAENPKISFEREGGFYETTLVKGKFQPPGFVMYEDIDARQWLLWEKRSGIRQGRKVLVLTSSLGIPIIKDALYKRGLSCQVVEVPSRFFGGNIQAAGLLTVRDFEEALKGVLSSGDTPEVITLPSRAFDPWGRDLEGVRYRTLAEKTGIQVILAG